MSDRVMQFRVGVVVHAVAHVVVDGVGVEAELAAPLGSFAVIFVFG